MWGDCDKEYTKEKTASWSRPSETGSNAGAKFVRWRQEETQLDGPLGGEEVVGQADKIMAQLLNGKMKRNPQ